MFKDFKLTKHGEQLLLSSNRNIGESILFTKTAMGSGKLEDFYNSQEIADKWAEYPLNTVRTEFDTIDDEGIEIPQKLVIGIAFDNSKIYEDTVLSEIGLYAKNERGEEVLVAYSLSLAPEGKETVIFPGSIYPRTIEMEIHCIISNDLEVTNIIEPTGYITKEVLEAFKNSIKNLGFRKIKGVLKTGENTILIPESEVGFLTSRAILNIEGYVYIEGVNYTIDKSKNAIVVNQTFEQDMNYEIIDPLPPSYVKQELDEFFRQVEELKKNLDEESEAKLQEIIAELDEHLKKLVDDSDEHFAELKDDFDKYFEDKKEALKGETGNGIIDITFSENTGITNIYDINYTNGTSQKLYIDNGKDGYSLDYIWDGTKLGIKLEYEDEYKYVDLKGDNGDNVHEITSIDIDNDNNYIIDLSDIDDFLIKDKRVGSFKLNTNDEILSERKVYILIANEEKQMFKLLIDDPVAEMYVTSKYLINNYKFTIEVDSEKAILINSPFILNKITDEHEEELAEYVNECFNK